MWFPHMVSPYLMPNKWSFDICTFNMVDKVKQTTLIEGESESKTELLIINAINVIYL